MSDFVTGDLALTLGKLYVTLTPNYRPRTTPQFDVLVLETVRDSLDEQDWAGYPDTLRAFVQLHHDELSGMVRQYGPGSAFDKVPTWGDVPYLLTHSPAIIAVCERLLVRPMLLRAVWDERWESDAMLEDLRGAWGHD